MKEKKKPTQKPKSEKEKSNFFPDLSSAADPQGSYTGVCTDPQEIPTQDADDL